MSNQPIVIHVSTFINDLLQSGALQSKIVARSPYPTSAPVSLTVDSRVAGLLAVLSHHLDEALHLAEVEASQGPDDGTGMRVVDAQAVLTGVTVVENPAKPGNAPTVTTTMPQGPIPEPAPAPAPEAKPKGKGRKAKPEADAPAVEIAPGTVKVAVAEAMNRYGAETVQDVFRTLKLPSRMAEVATSDYPRLMKALADLAQIAGEEA